MYGVLPMTPVIPFCSFMNFCTMLKVPRAGTKPTLEVSQASEASYVTSYVFMAIFAEDIHLLTKLSIACARFACCVATSSCELFFE